MAEERETLLCRLSYFWLLRSVFRPDQRSHLEPSSSPEVLAARRRRSQRADYSSAAGNKHAITTVPCGVSLGCTVGLRSACHVAHSGSKIACKHHFVFHALEPGTGSQALLHPFIQLLFWLSVCISTFLCTLQVFGALNGIKKRQRGCIIPLIVSHQWIAEQPQCEIHCLRPICHL